MSGDPAFTIVIPTRQEVGYIGRSLRQLCEARDQGGPAFDIVVVDGGSTDGTAEEVAGLADRVITERPGHEHTGIARARNVGAAASTSPFLFHTDADVLVPGLGELLVRALQAFADPKVVAVTAPVLPYPWESTRRDRLIHRVANAYFRASIRLGWMFSRGECQIVRRTAFEAIGGYNSNFIAGEDCDLFRRLARIGRVVFIADSCVYHSPRRFRQIGYARVLGIYVREWLWMNIMHRSYVREWPVVR